MREFFEAALPWVLMGIAIAIIMAGFTHKETEEYKKKHEKKLASGAAFGLLLGVMLNGCKFWDNHILGLCAGPLFGMALATIWKEK